MLKELIEKYLGPDTPKKNKGGGGAKIKKSHKSIDVSATDMIVRSRIEPTAVSGTIDKRLPPVRPIEKE